MSLAGLKLRDQWSQYVNDGATPISNATLVVDKLEGAIAQAAAQLIWIGKGYPAVECCKASPHIAIPLFILGILQLGELAHPMMDLTWTMGRLMVIRRSRYCALTSVLHWTSFQLTNETL
jgi:hypothetical protein